MSRTGPKWSKYYTIYEAALLIESGGGVIHVEVPYGTSKQLPFHPSLQNYFLKKLFKAILRWERVDIEMDFSEVTKNSRASSSKEGEI